MIAARLAIPFVIAAIASSTSIAGCRECTAVGCGGGFELTIRPEQARLLSGNYEIRLDVDGGRFVVNCEVADVTSCDEGEWTIEPMRDVFVRGGQFMPFEMDGFAPTITMQVSINDGDDTVGPDMVEVSVVRDGVEVAAEEYEPEYERNETFNGPGCGACESLERAELAVPGPAARE